MEDKIKLNIAILTISDSRTKETDKSGDLLAKLIVESDHKIIDREIVKDNIYSIRKTISAWIDKESVNAVISTGGTGVTGRDGTPEAVEVLFDKKINGFGEIFRYISYKKLRPLQSNLAP
jgi:molybdenum cofactor biosynthesis protein B